MNFRHCRGVSHISRLANWYPEKVAAYAFLTVPYQPPSPKAIDMETLSAYTKMKYGHELFGYWLFFDRDDAPKVIDDHVRFSFYIGSQN